MPSTMVARGAGICRHGAQWWQIQRAVCARRDAEITQVSTPEWGCNEPVGVDAFRRACAPAAPALAQDRPNIVLIYADDLGYGDVSAYGATSLQTAHVDRLARAGRRFTDAHSPAATCTPSRYALLTGEYAFRRPGTGVLPGDAALVIEPGRTTLASMLRRAGYATGVVGKWHLGLGPKGGPDWNGEIAPGPNDVGFDDAFIMAATGDRMPTVYVDNRRVVGLDPADPIRVSYSEPIGDWPTGRVNPEALTMRPSHGHDMTIVNGISRIGYMTGGRAALWKDEDMADVFTRKAVSYIEQRRDKPFFLYFATHEPHVREYRIHALPAAPAWARAATRSRRWTGRSARSCPRWTAPS